MKLKIKHLGIMCIAAGIFSLSFILPASANQQIIQTWMPGASIPKYVDPLPTFAGNRVSATTPIPVVMREFQQFVLPASVYSLLPAPFNSGTYVWGYKVGNRPPLYPGYTIVARRNTPATITYKNNLIRSGGRPPVLQKYLTVDQQVHWADPLGLQCTMYDPTDPECFTPYGYPEWPGIPFPNPTPSGAPVPAVVHLHGGEDPSAFDGGPEQWMTPNGLQGGGYVSLYPVPGNQAVYRYPNGQEATTLWFHDHALGTTRLNVYGGLAGFYLLRDNRDTGALNNPIGLPAGIYETEIVIQDRQFDTNGQWFFPDGGGLCGSGLPTDPCLNGPPPNPTVHPFWIPEFAGDVIVVNGKSWPFYNVEPRRYRLRFLNGSNARSYNMKLRDMVNRVDGPPIWVIGTDGGFLNNPVQVAPPRRLLMMPGERYDVIVDFSAFAGKTLTLVNNARTPFPTGLPADPNTTAQIMQFIVSGTPVVDTTCNPAVTGDCALRETPIVRFVNPSTGTLRPGVTITKKRQLVLVENGTPEGPLEVLLNNTKWSGIMASSMPPMGTILNPIPDSEPLAGNWATELPQVGSTELWEIINTTEDAHPIHVHLVQFQIMNRESFDTTPGTGYLDAWTAALTAAGLGMGDGPPSPYNTPNADGAIGGNLALSPFLLPGTMTTPNNYERGWKDTVFCPPGRVTRIVIRWAPQGIPVAGVSAGTNLYPFDPSTGLGDYDFAGNPGGPGYVWHCHILDHEDNEMMRPYIPIR